MQVRYVIYCASFETESHLSLVFLFPARNSKHFAQQRTVMAAILTSIIFHIMFGSAFFKIRNTLLFSRGLVKN